MSRLAIGQTLRHAGRAIEVISLLALLAAYRGHGRTFWSRYHIDPSVTLALCFGIGILVWATGTYIMLRARADLSRAKSKSNRYNMGD